MIGDTERAILDAAKKLAGLPNVENRCGDWRDIRDAMKELREAVAKDAKVQIRVPSDGTINFSGFGGDFCKMTPVEVPMTDELAKKLGFINTASYVNAKRILVMNDGTLAGKSFMFDALLLHVVNLEQMVLESQRQIEELRAKLADTGP